MNKYKVIKMGLEYALFCFCVTYGTHVENILSAYKISSACSSGKKLRFLYRRRLRPTVVLNARLVTTCKRHVCLKYFPSVSPRSASWTFLFVLIIDSLSQCQDIWSDWEMYKTTVEASQNPALMLVVDKWQQLQFVTKDFFSRLLFSTLMYCNFEINRWVNLW